MWKEHPSKLTTVAHDLTRLHSASSAIGPYTLVLLASASLMQNGLPSSQSLITRPGQLTLCVKKKHPSKLIAVVPDLLGLHVHLFVDRAPNVGLAGICQFDAVRIALVPELDYT